VIKVIFYLLFLTAFVWAQTTPTCKVVNGPRIVDAQDTSATVAIGKMTLSCMSNNVLEQLLITDSAYFACADRRKEDSLVIKSLLLKDSLATLYGATLKESNTNWNKNDSLLRVALGKSDTIKTHMDTIQALTEGKLKRCEENTPTFWERVSQVGGALVVGLLLGALISN
jgi:hypothetical protein